MTDEPENVERMLSQAAGDVGRIPSVADGVLKDIANEGTSGETGQAPPRRRIRWHTLVRITIPMATVAAMMVLAFVFLAAGRGSAVAFAEMSRQIENASTMTFIETADFGPGTKSVTRFYVKSPGMLRQELLTGEQVKQVEISNSAKGYHLTLLVGPKRGWLVRSSRPGAGDFGAERTALIPSYVDVSGKESQSKGPQPPLLTTPDDFLAELKTLIAGEHSTLGTRRIGNHKAIGFRLGKAGSTLDIWTDAHSGRVVEIVKQITLPNGRPSSVVMSDFAFDGPLDDSLFSIEPPAGYAIHERPSPWSPTNEADVVRSLKGLAQLNGGIFPEKLTAYSQTMLNAPCSLDDDQRDALSDSQTLMRTFLQTLPPGSTWKYVGAGKKLGDASQQVLWYAKPGQPQCRVVLADLSVRDVPPSEVKRYKAPTPQPTTNQTATYSGSQTTVYSGSVTMTSEAVVKVGTRTGTSQTATQPAVP